MATYMMIPNIFVCIVLLFCIVSAGRDMSDDDFEGSRTLVLEHSLQPGEFTKRGTIMIQSLKGNKAQFTATSSMYEQDIENLKALAQSNSLYRVRIPVKGSEDGEPMYVSSATKACGILESCLRDEITIDFDQSGEVLGVSVRADVSTCVGLEVSDSNLTEWHTAVEVTTTVAGPSPDTQTYIEKMKRDDQEKMKNQEGDNRSFLGKYWMYIVPVVIMMVIMSSADQQGGGGGAAR